MRASARDADHLGEDQPRSADGARAVMHQVPVGRHAVLGRILAHRREHHAVRDLHLAQPEGLEGRRHRSAILAAPGERAEFLGDQLVDGRDEVRRAQGEVVIGDRLGAGHQAEGEAQRIEIPEAAQLLEPDQRDIGRVLGLLDLLAPRALEQRQAPRRHSRPALCRRRVQARSHPPSRAWCPSRSRNARSPWHRRSARRSPRSSCGSGSSESCARASGW